MSTYHHRELGYVFPPSPEWLESHLTRSLAGIEFKISRSYYEGQRPLRTIYGKEAVERTEELPINEVVSSYNVTGYYGNGMFFEFRLVRIVDIDERKTTRRQNEACHKINDERNKNLNHGDRRLQFTSYSCHLEFKFCSESDTNCVTKKVVDILRSIFDLEGGFGDTSKPVSPQRIEAYERLRRDYPDDDYTKPLTSHSTSSSSGYRVTATPVNYEAHMNSLLQIISDITVKNRRLELVFEEKERVITELQEKITSTSMEVETKVKEAEERVTVTTLASFHERQSALIMEKDLAIKALMQSEEKLRQREEELVIERGVLQMTNLQLHKSNADLHEAQELNKKWCDWYVSRFPTTPTSK